MSIRGEQLTERRASLRICNLDCTHVEARCSVIGWTIVPTAETAERTWARVAARFVCDRLPMWFGCSRFSIAPRVAVAWSCARNLRRKVNSLERSELLGCRAQFTKGPHSSASEGMSFLARRHVNISASGAGFAAFNINLLRSGSGCSSSSESESTVTVDVIFCT